MQNDRNGGSRFFHVYSYCILTHALDWQRPYRALTTVLSGPHLLDFA
jgi:hypothetical protein